LYHSKPCGLYIAKLDTGNANLGEKGSLPLRYLCTAALVTIFLQLILGATLRHSATWDKELPTQLILAHVGGAFAVTVMLGLAAVSVIRHHKGMSFLTGPATLALSLLGVQLFPGSCRILNESGIAKRPAAVESDGGYYGRSRCVWGFSVCHHDCFDIENIQSSASSRIRCRVGRKTPGVIEFLMEEFAIDLPSSAVSDIERSRLSTRERVSAFWELTKPRITFLIVLTSAAGFGLGSRGRVDYLGLVSALFGIALLSSGIATLNQYAERDLDGLMRRTATRPLPTGKLAPWEALAFGAGLTVLAEIYLLVLVNPLSALLGLTVIAGYLFAYTPLKTRSSLSTVVGAFPGAVPPLIGWTAATGTLSIEAWVLFAILFLWQFPHFLAIAWMYREDYGRAGILMLPVVEPDGRVTAQQIVVYTLMLIPVSLLPTVLGLSGRIYFFGALILGLLFLYSSIRAAFSMSRQQARRLLLASVLYLPLLFILMVANK
jgi:protoheme IX farnesyltransferase